MSHPFLSDITMRLCHIRTFSTYSLLVLFHLVLLVRFISPPRQFRIKNLKLALAIKFWFICIFYGSIHVWSYTHTINLSRVFGKKSRIQVKFFAKYLNLSLEPKQYNCRFLCKNFPFKSNTQIWQSLYNFNTYIRYNLFVRNIPWSQCSLTWCQFRKTRLWISPIRPPIVT